MTCIVSEVVILTTTAPEVGIIRATFSWAGVFRELVIYDADQCYPEYVVLYKRKYAKAAWERAKK